MTPPAEKAAGPSIALPHDIAAIQRLSDWIDRRTEALALSPTAVYAVRVCLEEAVLNVVQHGEPPSGTGAAIRVCLGRADGCLVASVVDRGLPFDPLSVPPPPRAESLEAARVGGLGIPLMRRFSRTMTYRRADGVNVLEFQWED